MRLSADCRPAYGAAYRELFLANRPPRETCPSSGQPEMVTAEMMPLEGFEEFSGEPDLPPLELERTPVPAEGDAADERAEEREPEQEIAADSAREPSGMSPSSSSTPPAA